MYPSLYLWNKLEQVLETFQPRGISLPAPDSNGWINCFSPLRAEKKPSFSIKPDYDGPGGFMDHATHQRGSLWDLCKLLGIDIPNSGESLLESWEDISSTISGRRIWSCSEYLSRYSEKNWMIQKIVGHRDLAMIYGSPASGKSFLAIDLLISSSLSFPWTSQELFIEDSLNSLYCTEEGLSALPNRINTSLQHYRVMPDRISDKFLISTYVPQLFDQSLPGNVNAFIKEVKDLGFSIDLLVIDTLSSAIMGANENSSQDMRRVLYNIKKIQNELLCSIILIHHKGKSGNEERGSSVIKGDVDCLIEVSLEKGIGKMRCRKIKDASPFPDISFSLSTMNDSCYVNWSVVKPEKEDKRRNKSREMVFSAICKFPRVSVRKLEEITGFSRTQVVRHIKKLEEELLVFSSEGPRRSILYSAIDTIDSIKNLKPKPATFG